MNMAAHAAPDRYPPRWAQWSRDGTRLSRNSRKGRNGATRLRVSKATMRPRKVDPRAEKVSCHSRGRKKRVSLSLAWIVHQAATRPAMAPDAPREVTVSLPARTWAVSEVREPMTPEARKRGRKLERPISSCTVGRRSVTISQKRKIL